MSKRNKIIYWVATAWLSLGMVSTGMVQLLSVQEEVDMITSLGYPRYFISLLGITKILGVVAVLVPRFLIIKEWAYAGFSFTMAGAIYSHIAAGSSVGDIFPPLLLLVLTAVSWYFRPQNRRIVVMS